MELDDEEDLGGIRVGAKVNFDGIGGRFESRGDCGGVRGVFVALGLFITSGLSSNALDVGREELTEDYYLFATRQTRSNRHIHVPQVSERKSPLEAT